MPTINHISDNLKHNDCCFVFSNWENETNVKYNLLRRCAATGSEEANARNAEAINDAAAAKTAILNIIMLYAGTALGKTAETPVAPAVPVSNWINLDSTNIINSNTFRINWTQNDVGINGTDGVGALFMQSDQNTSSVYYISRPIIEWSENPTVAPGGVTRIFGKNLYSKSCINGVPIKCFIRLNGSNSQLASNYTEVEVYGHQYEQNNIDNSYSTLTLKMPNVANGTYSCYLYNREGDTWGIGTVGFTISSPANTTVYIRKASLDNATTTFTGTTTTTDEVDQGSNIQTSIINAFNQTILAGGAYNKAVVLLDLPGIYHIGSTLVIPPNVELRGLGKNNTTLKIKGNITWNKTPQYAVGTSIPITYTSLFTTPQPDVNNDCFIRICENSRINELTVQPYYNESQGTTNGIYSIAFSPVQSSFNYQNTTQNVSITNCRIVSYKKEKNKTVNLIYLKNSQENLIIDSCELIGEKCIAEIGLDWPHTLIRAKISNNYFKNSNNLNGSVGILFGSYSICENNIIEGFSKGLNFNSNNGIRFSNYIANNEIRFAGNDKDNSEGFSFESETDYYTGPVIIGTGFTVTTPAAINQYKGTSLGTGSLSGFTLTVINGRGYGQTRNILLNSAGDGVTNITSIIVPPFSTNLDSTSIVSITPAFSRNIVSGLNIQNSKGGLSFKGSAIDNQFNYINIKSCGEGVSFTPKAFSINTRNTPPYQHTYVLNTCWGNRFFKLNISDSSVRLISSRIFNSLTANPPALAAPFRGIVNVRFSNCSFINCPIIILDKVILNEALGTIFEFDNPSHAANYATIKNGLDAVNCISFTNKCVFDVFEFGMFENIQGSHRHFPYDVISLSPHGIKGVIINNNNGVYGRITLNGKANSNENPIRVLTSYLGTT